MKILGNILWLVFGGLMIALEYFVAGIALCVTLIGIPFGIQAFKLGVLSLWPFGNKVVNMPQEPGCLSVVMNILWILIGGIWIALSHLLWGDRAVHHDRGYPVRPSALQVDGAFVHAFWKEHRLVVSWIYFDDYCSGLGPGKDCLARVFVRGGSVRVFPGRRSGER